MADKGRGAVDALGKFLLCQTAQLPVICDFQTKLSVFLFKFLSHGLHLDTMLPNRDKD